jgi:hypothetical protein
MLKILLTGLFLSLSAQAQNVNINDVNADDAEETTISIRKGSTKPTQQVVAPEKAKATYEITEGTEEVTGEGDLLDKPAKANWTKACDSWKKEFKANNKDNQVLSINCGSPSCSKDGQDTVCKSMASYKLKVKLSE